MTDRQNGRLQRGVRVIGVMITYLATWTTNSVVSAIKLAIVNSIARIQALAAIQSTGISGNTRNKLMNALLMATPGAVYAGILLDWAIATGNGILEGEIAFSFTDLSKGSADDILHRNQLVRDRLVSNMPALILAGYPVTLIMSSAYTVLITNYATDVPLWKEASATIKTATGELALELNNLTITLFGSLKRNLLVYKAGTSVTFWSTAMNSMRTVTTGTRRIYLRIKFIDSVTGLTITNVAVVLLLDDNTYNKICSARGIASFKSLSNGNGIATCTKSRYNPVTLENIPIQDGKCLKMTVAMTLTALTMSAKAPKALTENKEVAATGKEEVTEPKVVAEVAEVKSPIVPEAPAKKRKRSAPKMVMGSNPAVVKTEVVEHKKKGK